MVNIRRLSYGRRFFTLILCSISIASISTAHGQSLSGETAPEIITAMTECESGAFKNILTGASLGACDILVRRSDLGDELKSRALTNRGIIHLKRGETNEARADFGRAIAMDDSLAQAWLGLAAAQIKSGSPRLALDTLDNAQDAGAQDSHILFNRALAFETLQDYQSAYSFYMAAADAEPDNAVFQAQPGRFSALFE